MQLPFKEFIAEPVYPENVAGWAGQFKDGSPNEGQTQSRFLGLTRLDYFVGLVLPRILADASASKLDFTTEFVATEAANAAIKIAMASLGLIYKTLYPGTKDWIPIV